MTADFWLGYQPGFRASRALVGSPRFFEEVDAARYELEPHIPDMVRFERWRGCDVLEAGCGIGTDGARFACAGARYTGVDRSDSAVTLARRRFELDGLAGRFLRTSITRLPFTDNRFDLVFSHGVIHHIDETEHALAEFTRVLRPGGTLLVMVYHRHSLNYHVSIMVLRRAMAGLLLVPGAPGLIGRVTGEEPEVLARHRRLLRTVGRRYLTDRALFLSHNTDGPGNPLSKVYSRSEIAGLLPAGLTAVRSQVRHLNLRSYPGGARVARSAVARRLERRIGWHLYLQATKVGGPGARQARSSQISRQ